MVKHGSAKLKVNILFFISFNVYNPFSFVLLIQIQAFGIVFQRLTTVEENTDSQDEGGLCPSDDVTVATWRCVQPGLSVGGTGFVAMERCHDMGVFSQTQ